jgi:FtsP/CotA-like multicopper oxidase with cupredoxin domain
MNHWPVSKAIVIFLALLPLCVSDVSRDSSVCARAASGGTVIPPAEMLSSNGQLRAILEFRSDVDDSGLTRYCYISGNAIESPTLRVRPGDEVVLDLKNELPAASTNLHFHGLEIPPVRHQDDVIHTLIQPFEPAFQYRFKIPDRQSPGLYWYHPHPHGYGEGQVLGGASGALIVEGIEKLKPEVRDLPERILVLRDQLNPVGRGVKRPASPSLDDPDDATGKDVSLNFVPVVYPLYRPAIIRVKPDRREFWRVLNASADTYFLLQVRTIENGRRVAQNLQLIAMDGSPVSREITARSRDEVLVSPGGRAEFIVNTPDAGALSQFVSRSYDTGPDGAANPDRVIATIVSGDSTGDDGSTGSRPSGSDVAWNYTGIENLPPAHTRKLYFSEDREDLRTPGGLAKYFITLEGKTPAVFDMNFKRPDITVVQGTVEDWIIENRSRESHVFHIHQVHFQVLARDGAGVIEPMLRDTIDLPYWDGKSAQYPSIRIRMDFRAPEITGTFLFHCHILEHEDAGMMGSVRVVGAR